MTSEFQKLAMKAKSGTWGDGDWHVLSSGEIIKVKHRHSKRVFTLRKAEGNYWDIFACSPMIDGPGSGSKIMRIDGLRKALLAIGFIRP